MSRLHRVLPPLALAATLSACAGSATRPLACQDDTDCAPDARCREATCVADGAPRALVSGPATGVAGAELAFDASSSTDADDGIAAYTWSVRVMSASCPPELGAASGSGFRATFACPGEFQIILVVTDRTGVSSEPFVLPLTVASR